MPLFVSPCSTSFSSSSASSSSSSSASTLEAPKPVKRLYDTAFFKTVGIPRREGAAGVLTAYSQAVQEGREPVTRDLIAVLREVSYRLKGRPDALREFVVEQSALLDVVERLNSRLSTLSSPMNASFAGLTTTAFSLYSLRFHGFGSELPDADTELSMQSLEHPGSRLMMTTLELTQQRFEIATEEALKSSPSPARGINTASDHSRFSPVDMPRLAHALSIMGPVSRPALEHIGEAAIQVVDQMSATQMRRLTRACAVVQTNLTNTARMVEAFSHALADPSSALLAFGDASVPSLSPLRRFLVRLGTTHDQQEASVVLQSLVPLLMDPTHATSAEDLVVMWWCVCRVGMEFPVSQSTVLGSIGARLLTDGVLESLSEPALSRLIMSCKKYNTNNDVMAKQVMRAANMALRSPRPISSSPSSSS